MKRALFVCLTLTSSATGSAGEKVSEGTEQTGLLQKVNRDQITSNKIKQVAATLTQLFQSASQLVRSGATPKVVSFSKETLQQIKDAVLPAMVDETKQDKKSLNDILAKFPPLVETYTSHIAELDNFRKAEKTLSDEHKVCRVKQQTVCDACTACKDEEKELWEEKITAEKICNNSKTELCDEVSFVPYNCAEVNGLTSCTWNRRTKAETYIEKCEEYYNKTQMHKESKEKCHKICDQVDKKLPVRTQALLEVGPTIKQECTELKSQLEAGSCKSQVRYTSALEALNAAWSLLLTLYDAQSKDVLMKVKDRKVECGTITSVECLLENINEKPCGDPEVDEKIGKCRKEPNCTWVDIEIPTPPVKPAPPPPAPHPCTPEFVAQEYGNLTSECFDLPPCVACGPAAATTTATIVLPTPGPTVTANTPAPFVATPGPTVVKKQCPGPNTPNPCKMITNGDCVENCSFDNSTLQVFYDCLEENCFDQVGFYGQGGEINCKMIIEDYSFACDHPIDISGNKEITPFTGTIGDICPRKCKDKCKSCQTY